MSCRVIREKVAPSGQDAEHGQLRRAPLSSCTLSPNLPVRMIIFGYLQCIFASVEATGAHISFYVSGFHQIQ